MTSVRACRTVVIAAGVLACVGGLLPVIKGADAAWADLGIATAPSVYGALAAILTTLVAAKVIRNDASLLGIGPAQLVAVLGLASTLIMVGFVSIADEYGTPLRLGFWVTIAGSAAMLLGATAEVRALRRANPAAPPAMARKRVRPNDLLVLAAGAAFVASCVTHYVEIDTSLTYFDPSASCSTDGAPFERATCLAAHDGWASVWNELFFPLSALPMICGLVATGLGVVGRLRRGRPASSPLVAAAGSRAMLGAAATGASIQVWWHVEGAPMPGDWGVSFWFTSLGLAALLAAALLDLALCRPGKHLPRPAAAEPESAVQP